MVIKIVNVVCFWSVQLVLLDFTLWDCDTASAVILCPEPNGRFALDDQCDGYIECVDGVAEKKLCPNGLLYHQRTKSNGDCVYASITTCEERGILQPLNSTDNCPRPFGFYPTGDSSNCGEYWNCAHGEATLTKCPEGLAFNIATYRCDWPDLVADCNPEEYLGFKCPSPNQDTLADEVPESEINQKVDTNSKGELNYFRHPNNCKKYFVCVNGYPRLYNCGQHTVFNNEKKRCDFYRNVPECANK